MIDLQSPTARSEQPFQISRDLLFRGDKTTRRHICLMIVVGLLVRLICVAVFYGEQMSPERDGFSFGWEAGRVARSLADGDGFASPLFGDTGPTAWVPPVYVTMLAGIFRLFGTYTPQAAVVILTINSLFSVLTVFPLLLMGRRMFGLKTARWAAWVWVLFPYGVFIPVSRIWGESLDALLVTLLLLATLHLASGANVYGWLTAGLLAGLAALTNPNTMSIVPGLWGWSCYQLRLGGKSWCKQIIAGVVGILIMVMPWFVRNYIVFGEVVPFRSNFWLEVYIGNNAETPVMLVDWTSHPASSPAEMEDYRRLGERRYMERKREQARAFIMAHPVTFLTLTIRRILFVWTGFWSLNARYLSSEPMQLPFVGFNLTFTFLIIAGFLCVWRTCRWAAYPFAVLVLFQPVVYYFTHPAIEYRHAIDPALVLLGTAGVIYVIEKVRRSCWTKDAQSRSLRSLSRRETAQVPANSVRVDHDRQREPRARVPVVNQNRLGNSGISQISETGSPPHW